MRFGLVSECEDEFHALFDTHLIVGYILKGTLNRCYAKETPQHNENTFSFLSRVKHDTNIQGALQPLNL